MQFLVVAYDGTDEGAMERRAVAKEAHVTLGREMIATGQVLFSTAILGDDDQTIGSMRVMQFPQRSDLDAWLEREPYVVGNVWQDVDIKPCKMGPAFEWMTLEAGNSEFRLDESDPAGDTATS